MSSPYGDAFLPATARSDLNYNLRWIASISTVEYFSFFTTKVFSKRLFLIWSSSAESFNEILRAFGTCVATSCLLQSIIIHKLLTSQFSKLKTKISEFSIDEPLRRQAVERQKATHLHHYIFYYSLQYQITNWCFLEITCDFQLFFHFVEGSGRCIIQKHGTATERKTIIVGRNGVWIFAFSDNIKKIVLIK